MSSHKSMLVLSVIAALSPLSVGCRTTESKNPARLPDVEASFVQPASYNEPVDPPVPVELPEIDDSLPLPDAVVGNMVTLESLEQTALAMNPSVAEARARVEAARGMWVQVGLPPNTEIGYSGQQVGSGGLAEQHGLFVGQEFIRGGKLQLNRAVACEEIRQAEQRYLAQQQRVLTDVRLAYYDLLIAQQRESTAQQLVDIARGAADSAEALRAAREVGAVDVMQSRVELQSAELVLVNSRNVAIAAWQRLMAVVGTPNRSRTLIDGDLHRPDVTVDYDEVLSLILTSSPEVAAALAGTARARWMVDRAMAEPIPDVDIQAIAQSDNSTGSANANVQMTFPIPWLNRNQGGIRAARAEQLAAERAVSKLELDLQQRLADVYRRYSNARNQVEEFSKEGGILPNSEATLDFVRQGYQAGELSYLELITAQRTYSQTQLAYLESLGEMWAAAIEMDGLLLKDSLSGETLK